MNTWQALNKVSPDANTTAVHVGTTSMALVPSPCLKTGYWRQSPAAAALPAAFWVTVTNTTVKNAPCHHMVPAHDLLLTLRPESSAAAPDCLGRAAAPVVGVDDGLQDLIILVTCQTQTKRA
jgi:hypothetical protein